MNKLTNLKKTCLVTAFMLSGLANFCFAQTRAEVINMAYFASFGRSPSAAESKAWTTSNYNGAQITANNRNYLRTNAYEKSQTLQRAFLDATGGTPTQVDINAYANQNKTYAEIINDLVNTLRSDRGRRLSTIAVAYQQTLGRLASQADFNYWMAQQVYTYVQLKAFNLTAKTRNVNTPTVTPILGGLNSAGITTLSLSPGAMSSLVASGGGNLVASGGGNLVASGGGNLVASGGGN
jgi:hypothetical protein